MLESLDRLEDPYPLKSLPARRRVIVISDGADQGSRATIAQVIDKATRRRVQIDAIAMTSATREFVPVLQSIARSTGGSLREAASDIELELRISRGMESLLETPVATFPIQNLHQDGKTHTIGVRWAALNTTDSLPVMFPEGAWWSFGGLVMKWHWAAAGIVLFGGLGLVLFGRRKPAPKPKVTARVATPATSGHALPSQPSIKPPAIPRSPTIVEEPQPAGNQRAYAATVNDTGAGGSPVAAYSDPERLTKIGPRNPDDEDGRKTRIAPVFRDPSPGNPCVILRAVDGPLLDRAFPVETTEFWIGAAAGNHLQVADDHYISGKHCCLRFAAGVLRIQDNRSSNKTFVNGEALGNVVRILNAGDEVQTGSWSRFRVEAPGA
jgi:hypothetical protein